MSEIVSTSCEKKPESSINLMWIGNEKWFRRATSVDSGWQSWIEKTPGSIVNFWYDSKLIDKKIIEELCVGMICKDIRTIDIVRNNEDIFFYGGRYFIVDLLKLVIITHELSVEDRQHAVFADLKVIPMEERKLFGDKNMQQLQKHGIITNKGSIGGSENQFVQAFSSYETIKALIFAINVNLTRGLFCLHNDQYLNVIVKERLYTSVFYYTINYVVMFYHIFKEKGFIKIKEGSSSSFENFNETTGKYYMFGNLYHGGINSSFVSLGNKNIADPQKTEDVLKFTDKDGKSLNPDDYESVRDISSQGRGNAHSDVWPEAPSNYQFQDTCTYWQVPLRPIDVIMRRSIEKDIYSVIAVAMLSSISAIKEGMSDDLLVSVFKIKSRI